MSHLVGKEHFELLGGRTLNRGSCARPTRFNKTSGCSSVFFSKNSVLKSLLIQIGSGLQAVDCGTRSYREVVRGD